MLLPSTKTHLSTFLFQPDIQVLVSWGGVLEDTSASAEFQDKAPPPPLLCSSPRTGGAVEKQYEVKVLNYGKLTVCFLTWVFFLSCPVCLTSWAQNDARNVFAWFTSWELDLFFMCNFFKIQIPVIKFNFFLIWRNLIYA